MSEEKDGAGLEDILDDLCFMILAGTARATATGGPVVGVGGGFVPSGFAPSGLAPYSPPTKE